VSGEAEVHTGGCACDAVRYRVEGDMRPVVACHCSQCRKAFTNYGAFSAARRGDLSIENMEEVTWFESSPGVRRGFCRRCGGALFWDRAGNDFVSLSAGSLDQPSGLRQVRHIFMDDKADFYEIGDGLEKFPQGQGGDQWPGGGG